MAANYHAKLGGEQHSVPKTTKAALDRKQKAEEERKERQKRIIARLSEIYDMRTMKFRKT